MRLHVLEAGVAASVQDEPRLAQLALGLPAAGPADPHAFAAALALVGATGAALELIGLPFTFRCDDRRVVAVTGRDVWLRTAARVPGWMATLVRAGEEVRVTGTARYAYLAVSGGFDLEPVLGSRATYAPAGLGPVPRALVAGDSLGLGRPAGIARAGARLAPADYRSPVAAIAGPHWDRFSEAAQRAFFAEAFAVRPDSDRMGVRLGGPRLDRQDEGILTCAMVHGAVQVPRGGSPIALGPDAQTTGGYPVIATVSRAALGRLAQALPGERVRFAAVAPAQAASELRALARSLGPHSTRTGPADADRRAEEGVLR